jgi:PIN like domain
LRKRSGASSIVAKQLSNTVFYLDESIYSRSLAEGMREAGANIVTSFETGLAGSTDEKWLAAIGEKSWLALMRDQNIRRRSLERRALVAAGVGAFVCTAAEATAGEVRAAVTALLQKMVNVAVSEPRPFIFTFGLAGRLRQIPHRERL